MKRLSYHIAKLLLFIAFLSIKQTAFSQTTGRVLINEYMFWPSNACGPTAEFVELMNFGPGPVDIGCYILTDGDFSVTIPPNTILQPGEFYILSGQSVLTGGCGNIDSTTVNVDLNWNTCGCTSGPIPTTGEAFLSDNGTEQLLFLDPNLKVVDAVIRSLPAQSSSLITTSNIGGCTSKSFDLDTMTIRYETLGMSAGRSNSFARTRDGDCVWVKDPQISANATNNRGGDPESDIAYDLYVVNAMDCNNTGGGVEIFVKYHDYEGIFPMNYTIVYDVNRDGLYNFNDQYIYGVDSTPISVDVNGLNWGSYRLVIASVNGCYLASFDFTILPCYVLPVKLVSFKKTVSTQSSHTFDWVISDVENLKEVILEKSTNNTSFVTEKIFKGDGSSGTKKYTAIVPVQSGYRYYRLKIISKDNSISYSPILNTAVNVNFATNHVWPNPASNVLNVQVTSSQKQKASYKIIGVHSEVGSGKITLQPGHNNFTVPTHNLAKGVYQLIVSTENETKEPISFRFVKQ